MKETGAEAKMDTGEEQKSESKEMETAMENGPFIDDFPIPTTICRGFSMAMLNNQMVTDDKECKCHSKVQQDFAIWLFVSVSPYKCSQF